MSRRLLLRGVAAFNAGRFLTAHEIWEAVWNETVGEEKRFVQGLVQLAAGGSLSSTRIDAFVPAQGRAVSQAHWGAGARWN